MKIKVKVRPVGGQGVETITTTVVAEHEKFFVLNTGKFNFCAFKDDIRSGAVVAI